MLGMVFGCGFRRSELVGLELGEIQIRQSHRAVVDLIGKGGHIRTVPIPEWVKAALDQWTSAAGVREGRIFRAVARTGKIWGKGITQNAVWYVVRTCCERVGLETSRRTTCGEPARSCVTTVAVNWSRCSSGWGMRRYRRPLSRLQAEPRKPGKRSFQAEGGSAAPGVEL